MITFALPIRQARPRALIQALDAATLPGRLRVFAGPRPQPGAAVPADGVLLAEIVLARPSARLDGDTLTLTPVPETLVARSGVPTWARFVDGDGLYVADVDAGADGDLRIDPLPLYAGGSVALELVLTEPE